MDKLTKIYMATYKCRLCGEVVSNAGTANKDTASKATMYTVIDSSGYSPQFESPNAPMQFATHACKDGSYGMSDFLGMKETQEKEKQE